MAIYKARKSKENQNEFKNDLNKIKRGRHKSNSKKVHYTTLKHFTMYEKKLSMFLRIIVQCSL